MGSQTLTAEGNIRDSEVQYAGNSPHLQHCHSRQRLDQARALPRGASGSGSNCPANRSGTLVTWQIGVNGCTPFRQSEHPDDSPKGEQKNCCPHPSQQQECLDEHSPVSP